MPYIYKITNNINGKTYIGKTLKDNVQKRWKEHCNDYNKDRTKNRPLYSAMKKYGTDAFSIECIEECSDSDINEKEVYWIQFYSSFLNGYNATLGGDGRQYADYDVFLSLFKEGKNITQISKITGFCVDTVSLGLQLRGGICR